MRILRRPQRSVPEVVLERIREFLAYQQIMIKLHSRLLSWLLNFKMDQWVRLRHIEVLVLFISKFLLTRSWFLLVQAILLSISNMNQESMNLTTRLKPTCFFREVILQTRSLRSESWRIALKSMNHITKIGVWLEGKTLL